MTVEEFKIDFQFAIDLMEVCIALFVVLSIVKAFRPLSFSDIKPEDIILNFIKSIFYGLLAGFIYFVSMKNNLEEIDVLTFFTFILACFEATHNLLNSIGIVIAAGIRMVYESYFKTKY